MNHISIRLGRFEFFAQRERTPSGFSITREKAGEIIIDLPMFFICLTNHRRFEALNKA